MGGGAAAVEGVARGGSEGGRLRREWSGQSRRRVVAVKHLGTRERQSVGRGEVAAIAFRRDVGAVVADVPKLIVLNVIAISGQGGAAVAARHLNDVIVGRGDADRRDACLNGLIGECVARKGLGGLGHPKQVRSAGLQRARGEHVAKRERHIGIFVFPHGFKLFEVKARAAESGVQFVGREREGGEERVPGIKQHSAPPHHRGHGAPVAEGEKRGLVRGKLVQHQRAAPVVETERHGQTVG